MSIPKLTFVGRSGSGKTTLLIKLITELRRRGYRLATIKHHPHGSFDFDQPGKDSWRHAQAGSQHVVVAAPDKIASVRHLDRELTLDEVTAGIEAAAQSTPVDIILVEGYKKAPVPTFEVVRAANSPDLVGRPEYRLAIATDLTLNLHVPRFALDDITGIVDLIQASFLTDVTPPSERTAAPQPLISPPAPASPEVVCVVGRAKSGRTALLVKLVRELLTRGYRVGTVKHHAHPGFEVDQPGKDTWRHAQAGSHHVVLSSPDKVASIRHVDRELGLDEIAANMHDVDVVLAEGFLRTGKHLIEVVRAARSTEPICQPDQLLALATDTRVPYAVPQHDLHDATGLVDQIVERVLS